MAIVNKSNRIYLLIIVGLLIALGIREGCNSARTTTLLQSVQDYSDSAKFTTAENGALIAYNQSLELENEEQMLALLSKYDTLAQQLETFKNVESTTIIRQEVVIVRDTVPFETQIPCDFEPFEVRRDSMYYSFLGTIGQDFFSIDSLRIPNEQSIIIGSKKLGFLKGTERRVEIINSNPFMQVSNIGSYVIDDSKKWYQRPLVTFLIGVGAGYGGAQLNK